MLYQLSYPPTRAETEPRATTARVFGMTMLLGDAPGCQAHRVVMQGQGGNWEGTLRRVRMDVGHSYPTTHGRAGMPVLHRARETASHVYSTDASGGGGERGQAPPLPVVSRTIRPARFGCALSVGVVRSHGNPFAMRRPLLSCVHIP